MPFIIYELWVYPIFYNLTESGELLKIQSSVTGKMYNTENSVYILNRLQVWKYLMNNAILLDILPGENEKIVYVFDRKDTYNLYDLWCKRKL